VRQRRFFDYFFADALARLQIANGSPDQLLHKCDFSIDSRYQKKITSPSPTGSRFHRTLKRECRSPPDWKSIFLI
jgi:hypothetical protein